MKRKALMPNMDELISRISRTIANGATDQIWISKFDLDADVCPTTVIEARNGPMHICNNRRQLHRLLQIPKGVLWLGGHPDHISRKN